MLGSNVPAIGGIHNAVEIGSNWGCECIQVYVTNSRSWDLGMGLNIELPAKVLDMRKRCPSIRSIVAHVPFLVNLATNNEDLYRKSIARLRTELVYAWRYGVKNLVLHPGANPDKINGMKRIIDAVNRVLDDTHQCHDVNILFETMACQGNYLGDLPEIFHMMQYIEQDKRIGICMDTAHMYQRGYDLNNDYDAIMQKIEDMVGVDKIKCIHLNDSMTELGSRVDRHSSIGNGFIDMAVYRRILNEKVFKEIPIILELPDVYETPRTIEMLKAIIN